MIWRYVDTKLKEDPLDVLDNWMIRIYSRILLRATILIRLLSKYTLLRLAFYYDISAMDQLAYHFHSFPTGYKRLLSMTGMINLIPDLKK